MKYLLIHKETKQVKMVCDDIPQYDNNIFDIEEKELSETDLKKIDESVVVYWVNNQLKFQKHNETKKQELKNKLKNATTIDEIKNIVFDIIN